MQKIQEKDCVISTVDSGFNPRAIMIKHIPTGVYIVDSSVEESPTNVLLVMHRLEEMVNKWYKMHGDTECS